MIIKLFVKYYKTASIAITVSKDLTIGTPFADIKPNTLYKKIKDQFPDIDFKFRITTEDHVQIWLYDTIQECIDKGYIEDGSMIYIDKNIDEVHIAQYINAKKLKE
jgi:DNA helicase TIP49 (TBP-interacting protein)